MKTKTRKRCSHCGKFEYGESEIITAVLGTAKTSGLASRYYECPKQSGIFHVTTQTEKR